MTNEIKTPNVEIPAEILSENHRKAYSMAYVAGFTGRKLAFVAPVALNSIVRGYLTGERDRLYFVDITATSGNTLAACRLAIGTGDALVFSGASLPLFTF